MPNHILLDDKIIESKIELLKKKCREHNLKITPQRIAVYRELVMTKDHPNAELIHRRVKKLFPNISLDTVNRTLLTFSRIGIIDIVTGSGNPKRFDADMTPHNHFRCIQCNSLIDIYNGSNEKIEVPQEVKEKFTVLRKNIYFEGICDTCNNNIGK
jgi:Fur family peroxide stress response transcriptional regulator